jgi:diaminopropionate ammonia-lyase
MTPLRRVGNVLIKDESQRELGAFKIVGVSHAMKHLTIPPGSTIVCASAGNHGRAVAHVGREHGFPVRVYMSASTPGVAQQRIRDEGAEVVLVNGTYEDAVARARDDGGFVISDTAWKGYEEVPRLIMKGYMQILDEAETQWERAPESVFVQAGVGSLAAAVVTWFREKHPRTQLTVVRPQAHPTIMKGLDCIELSSLADPILRNITQVYITDDDARDAMRVLARAGISAGPSGAAGYAVARWSRVLAFVINTEGG